MSQGLKFDEGNEMAKFNSHITPANQRMIYAFIDKLFENRAYIPVNALIKSTSDPVSSIKTLLFSRCTDVLFPTDRIVPKQLRSFFLDIMSDL
jgi:hypothetical protein